MSRLRSSTVGWGVLSLSVAGLNTFVLAGGILRGQPAFWTDAGGYPLWMRTMVEYGFYPAFLLLMAIAAGLSRIAFRHLAAVEPEKEAVGRWLVSLAAIEWIVFGVALGMAVVALLQKWIRA